LGISEGGPMAIVFAATYPERCEALALYGTFAKLVNTEGYSSGITPEDSAKFVAGIEKNWGSGKSSKFFAPSRADDEDFVARWGQQERNAMGPGAAHRLLSLNSLTDVRDVLPLLRVPTLVLHRTGDRAMPVTLGRYLGERIPDAKYTELEGEDHLYAVGDTDSILSEVEELVTGERSAPEPDRVLTTVMFADIVQSTEKATEIGDKAWKELLERFYLVAREKLAMFRGRELDTAGDGFFASFDGPARSVQCAHRLCTAVTELGLTLRVGIHTGECEVFGDKYSGVAVHLGARVAGKAEPGEVLVSSTVKDLTAGSGLNFEDCGEHALKGVPGEWRLYRASI